MMPQTVLLWRPAYLAIFRYEHPFRQYPTTIPAICGITGRTIITSICRPRLVTVVLVSREQLWLCRRGAQSAIQYKLVGTALMGQKTHDFLQ